MRSDRLFFTVLSVPFDFAALIAAGLTAWSLRFNPWLQAVRPVQFTITFGEYVSLLVLAAVFTLLAIALMGLYRFPKPEFGPFGVTLRLLLATSITLSAIALTVFFRQELFGSRFLVLAGWALATVFLVVERAVVDLIETWLARRWGLGMRNAVVVGTDELSDRLSAVFDREPKLGLRVVKRMGEPDIAEVRSAVGNPGVEAIVLADPNYPRDRILELIDFAHEQHLTFFFVPNLFQSLTTNATVSVVRGVPLVELKRTALDGWGRAFKRAVDIFGAAIGLVLFAPIMLVIAVAVKLADPSGPVIYRNRRAGQRGEPFSTYKFRSMYWRYCTGPGTPDPKDAIAYEEKLAAKHSERQGPVWKILNDPRRTRVGDFLEKTSLDELPQFFNVLRGNMSLVGPRPHMLEQVADYEKHHRRVLAIKPGITGLAQISGRSNLDFEDEVRLDTYYLEHWSPWLDFKVLALTPFVVLFRRHSS